MHRQEERLVGHLGDQRQLMLDAPAHLGRHAVRVTPPQTALGLLAQPGSGRLTSGSDFLGVFVAQFIQRKAALRGDPERFGQ